MNALVKNKLPELNRLCVEHKVEKLYLFGSAASSEFNEHSDLDFAVLLDKNLSPLEHGEAFLNLLSDLQTLFNRKIDLVSYRVIKNRIFKEELDKTKVSLYAAA